MLSLPLEEKQEIPKTVLMYFSYQNRLDYEHTAYLYDYLLKNEDNYRDILETYRERMTYFCLEQIQKNHINSRV